MTEVADAGDSLEELAKRAAAGDAAALDALLAAIQDRVLRVCGRMLPCRQDAEEACQDALLKVSRRIGQFEGRSRFTTWLYTIASNSARDTYAALKRRAVERPVDEFAVTADPRRTSVIAGSRVDLLESMEKLELVHPDLVEPFMLRDISELDYNEIARQLDLPLGTVKSRIHRARQELRVLLEGRT